MVNKTKIEWADYTWNPVTGCNHGCWYCYARRMAERFKGTKAFPKGFTPTFWQERLSEIKKIKNPSRVFVCSMSDLFGDWVNKEIINAILNICNEYKQHDFMFLTKNPYRYLEFAWPSNCWRGVTITGEVAFLHLDQILQPSEKCFISVEPFLKRVDHFIPKVRWVIIGGMRDPKKIQPKKEWLDGLIAKARSFDASIFMKDNLDIDEGNVLREIPDELECEL